VYEKIPTGKAFVIFTTRRAIFARPSIRRLFLGVVEQMILEIKHIFHGKQIIRVGGNEGDWGSKILIFLKLLVPTTLMELALFLVK